MFFNIILIVMSSLRTSDVAQFVCSNSQVSTSELKRDCAGNGEWFRTIGQIVKLFAENYSRLTRKIGDHMALWFVRTPIHTLSAVAICSSQFRTSTIIALGALVPGYESLLSCASTAVINDESVNIVYGGAFVWELIRMYSYLRNRFSFLFTVCGSRLENYLQNSGSTL